MAIKKKKVRKVLFYVILKRLETKQKEIETKESLS